jgi:hypothetical protein
MRASAAPHAVPRDAPQAGGPLGPVSPRGGGPFVAAAGGKGAWDVSRAGGGAGGGGGAGAGGGAAAGAAPGDARGEYLKNVLLRYMSTADPAVRERLEAAVCAIMEFTPAETGRVAVRAAPWACFDAPLRSLAARAQAARAAAASATTSLWQRFR